MAYLLDTNVISEVRKGDRCNWGVRDFFDQSDDTELFLPVQVIGEIRAGISKAARQQDSRKAEVYEQWLETLLQEFGNRIIEFDADCAQVWGTLLSGEKKDPHTVDKQIAAIAMVWDLTLVTRDGGGGFKTITGRNLRILNPFKAITTVHGRRARRDNSLILSELNPNSVVDHEDESIPVSLTTFGMVREVCPKCSHCHLHLVLRQRTVRIAHLFCAECASCFDAHYVHGASALTICTSSQRTMTRRGRTCIP
jgi:predicted nucleic acid-binding protein